MLPSGEPFPWKRRSYKNDSGACRDTARWKKLGGNPQGFKGTFSSYIWSEWRRKRMPSVLCW